MSAGLIFGTVAGVSASSHWVNRAPLGVKMRELQAQRQSQELSVHEYRIADILAAAPCVFRLVSTLMTVQLPPSLPLPEVRPEGIAELEELKAVTKRLWGFEVPKFINIYDPEKNIIYLFRDFNFYHSHKRSIYDSLAHEFVHFVQVKVRKTPLSHFSDAEENEAINIQNQFRNRFGSQVIHNQFHCPY
jgi:hypothetical protein